MTISETRQRVWALEFTAPARMLSSNTRNHWSVTGPVHRLWREASYTYARAAKLPRGLLLVRVDVELRFPTGGRRDASNYHTHLCKPIVDGLGPAREQVIRKGARTGTTVREVGYGLIPDDTEQYLQGPYPRIGAPVGKRADMPYGQVLVTITDLSGGAP